MTRTPSGTAFRTPTERRQERCPDQTRPDQTVVEVACGSSVAEESIHRYCPKCDRTLPVGSFYRSTRDGFQSQCKDCKRAYNAANREQIAERHRRYLKSRPGYKPRPPKLEPQRFRQYGLTEAEHDVMLAAQDGLCAICRKPSDETLAIDHDHETGAVRGLLCRRCNTGIGLLRDDPQILIAAVTYLEGGDAWMGRSAARFEAAS